MPNSSVRRIGDTVLIQGQAALNDLASCVIARIQRDRLNGASPARYAHLLASIHAAMSDNGQLFAETTLPQQQSTQEHETDWMTTAQAAQTLDITERQMRRLARTLDGAHRAGNTWVLKREPVLALAEERKRKARNGQRQ